MLTFIGRIAMGLGGAAYIFSGLALAVMGLPLAFLPFGWDSFARWAAWAPLALLAWLGIASVPGCLTAVHRALGGRLVSRRWVRRSLWGGLIASSAGLAGGSLYAGT